MAIKRIIGKGSMKHKTCLSCGHPITDKLEDNIIYFCENCGQEHYVDVYEKWIALTVKERPDLRRRHRGNETEVQQQRAREALIRKTEAWRGKMEMALNGNKEFLFRPQNIENENEDI